MAGNLWIHWLTYNKRQELRVDMKDFDDNEAYATYDDFKVDSERQQYKLSSLGNYAGTAGRYGLWR